MATESDSRDYRHFGGPNVTENDRVLRGPMADPTTQANLDSVGTKRDLQLAGIAVLMSLATSVTATGAFPISSVDGAQLARQSHGRRTGSRRVDEVSKLTPATLVARLRADHLLRNSLYLVLSYGLQAALGFAFWIIAARLFSAADVGRASSLISAMTLAAFLAMLGLNSAFVRFMPTAPDRDALITAGLLVVSICGAGIGLGYVLLTPLIAPRLAFVAHQPAMAAGFVLLTAAGAVSMLTDSIFIADRKAGYNALVDGGVGGVIKVASSLLLVGTGAYGLFCASAGGFAAADLASLVLMAKVLRWRPALRSPRRVLLPLLHFSGANYLGNGLNALPSLVVPLIVLDRIGAPEAAYYAVSFQLAQILYSAAYAVEQAFLAEGSHAGVIPRALRRRSAGVLIAILLPACLVLSLSAHWALLAFGVKYSVNGTVGLVLLAAAAAPIAGMNWLMTVLRLAGRLKAIVLGNGAYAAAICTVAWFLAPHGLTAVCAAWLIGALFGSLVAGIAVAGALPRAAPARHRRTTQPRQA